MKPPRFPDYLPELQYGSDEQTQINYHSFKHRLVTWLSHRRVEHDDYIYIEYNDGGNEFMPLFTLTKALVLYNEYLDTGDESKRQAFFKLAERLIDDAEHDGDLAGWKHAKSFVLPGYPDIKRSYSALFQARGLSLLIRYHALNEEASRDGRDVQPLIEGILESFKTPSDDGGVKKNGTDWYLEYSYGHDSPIVYNGFMSALIGLRETAHHGPGFATSTAEELYQNGLETLVDNKEDMLFTVGPLTWFRYDSNYLFLVEGSYPDIMLGALNMLRQDSDELDAFYQDVKKRVSWSKPLFSVLEFPYYVYKKLLPKLV